MQRGLADEPPDIAIRSSAARSQACVPLLSQLRRDRSVISLPGAFQGQTVPTYSTRRPGLVADPPRLVPCRPQTSPPAPHLRRIRFSSQAIIATESSALALPSVTRRIGCGRDDRRVRVRP